jgi:hypothetical protein
MKKKGYILSKNWAEYDGNNKSVICYDNLTNKDLEYAIRSAYRQWAIHCAKRRQFKRFSQDMHYYRLLLTSLKKYGLFITLFKIFRFFIRHSVIYSKEKLGYRKKIDKAIKEGKGVAVGRLTLIFDMIGLRLYWNSMELTRGVGFLSSLDLQDKQSYQSSFGYWNLEKTGDTQLLLRRRCGVLPVEETWKIEVIDEKQIDWNVEINIKKEVEILERKVAIILSQRYRKWVDAWGEGQFPPINDHREVGLRNPKSNFIGLRGRKKLKGQLPTILLDLSKNDDEFFPSIRNATQTLGARMLEVKTKISNGNKRYAPGRYKFFSGRIKIVEEDFKKRKLDKDQ